MVQYKLNKPTQGETPGPVFFYTLAHLLEHWFYHPNYR